MAKTKILGTLAAAAMLGDVAAAQDRPAPSRAPQVMKDVAPGLAAYTDQVLFGTVWERPGLSKRDRSLVTVTTLISSGNTGPLANHLNLAIDNGLTPREISGIITHLGFYAGWPSAVGALAAANEVFKAQGVAPADIASGSHKAVAPPADDAARAAAVERQVGPVAPGLATLTNEVLFGDLWLRTDLAPRDRSLVTIAALARGGDTDQLKFHIERGLRNGLTREELGEAMTHLAFYAGWPKAMSAVKVLGEGAGDPMTVSSRPSAEPLRVTRQGAAPSAAQAQNFTGAVTLDTAFSSAAPARVSGARVTFEPGARTNWHTHPLGQTLVVTEGAGLVGHVDGTIEEIRGGDVVWIPPGVKHWHGAGPTSRMHHVAIAESLDGSRVAWMEPVTEAQYLRSRSKP